MMRVRETIHHGSYRHARTVRLSELTAESAAGVIRAHPYAPPVVTVAMGARMARDLATVGAYDLGWTHWEVMPSAPLSPACGDRAQVARDLATRAGIAGQLSPELEGAPGRLAWRLIWDGPAAGEYPRPMLADGVDCERIAPEYAARVWHHIAGAVIIGQLCCPLPPAGHRDALADIAREIRAGAES